MVFAEFLEGLVARGHNVLFDEVAMRSLGHEIDRHAESNSHGIAGFVARLGSWAKEHPGTILNFLRHIRPVLKVKNVCIVTSHSGCLQVLQNHEDFGVIYADKMKMITQGDNFFLGMDDDEPAGTSARSAMTLVFRREDITTKVTPIIKALAEETLKKLPLRFDVVGQYFKVVPALFAIRYFGFSSSVDPERLQQTTQILFEYLFIDVENDPELASRAAAAAAQLRGIIEQEIRIGGNNSETDSVLSRSLRLSETGHPAFSTRAIRNNFIGLLIGLIPTTAKSAAMAFDLLTRNNELQERTQKTLQGEFKSFQDLVREATRLNPINPGLFRKARHDTVINSDGHITPIEKDCVIFVGTSAGMRDPKHIEAPDELQPGRPESAYMTYGAGLHACFGRYINDLHIALLLRELFLSDTLKRADGNDGDLQFDGPFPDSLILELKNPLDGEPI